MQHITSESDFFGMASGLPVMTDDDAQTAAIVAVPIIDEQDETSQHSLMIDVNYEDNG